MNGSVFKITRNQFQQFFALSSGGINIHWAFVDAAVIYPSGLATRQAKNVS